MLKARLLREGLQFLKCIPRDSLTRTAPILWIHNRDDIRLQPPLRWQHSIYQYKGEMTLLQRVGNKLFPATIKKGKLAYRANLLYEYTVDGIDYPLWFKQFEMSDTFASWFIITELHMWMLMVKMTGEADDGKLLKICLLETMWHDVEFRVQRLKSGNMKLVRKQVCTFSEQFNAALFGYDEGLQSGDTVLASALWRRFFNMECDDPIVIERMVKYVRMNIQMLDNISKEDFFTHSKKIMWTPLKDILTV